MNLKYIVVYSLINSVNTIKYIPYSLIRPLYLDLYNKFYQKDLYNLEHIVPKCYYKHDSELTRDMHNIILYPNQMNLHRSNYKYVDEDKYYNELTILDNKGNVVKERNQIIDISIKNNRMKTFVPVKKYRGSIARSCMYFINQYPEYESIILDKVIDAKTILTWHTQYPVTKFEYQKNNVIKDLQGNNNIYVIKPIKLIYDINDWYKIRI